MGSHIAMSSTEGLKRVSKPRTLGRRFPCPGEAHGPRVNVSGETVDEQGPRSKRTNICRFHRSPTPLLINPHRRSVGHRYQSYR